MNISTSSLANTVVVLDFETTGLSPNQGDRAIEIGAVKLENGQVVDQFQQLMNPGRRVSSFIEGYTGITNTMLSDAPSCEEVMTDFASFIGDANLVAHNASFDQRFLDAEFDRISHRYDGEFACSLLIARRLYQDAPNHKLGSLVTYKNIETDGVFHRALADSEMTAKLWLQMLEDMKTDFDIQSPSFKLMQQISKKTKAAVPTFLYRTGKGRA
ncbi:DNA polymerase III subunit epsilon [Photobacterium jeanii]|uniref:DNA-directed DNA polymerase n=1 Tax=Photobacterium jeanii TaxID=858640 RepID=A0A178K3P1_9GAMM|nr:3'-5' exonuclease [Photobacterium jeanii]OAN11344.1 DNA polymerase III subunit epsilon [Photobacterium jeanii]PST90864.1 3'-5' exonuclease [Photobacterium jeanii]